MIKYPYKGEGIAGIKKLAKNYDAKFLLNLYSEMLRIRLVEEAVADQYHEDQMKTPIHLAIGQEATAVGSCTLFKKTDLVFCGHRTHAIYLAKGGDLNAMIAEFFCRITGCAGSRGGSMHLLDKSVGMMGSSAIVAGVVPIATGSALTSQMTGKNYLTTVYFGDAASEEGTVWESLNFAVLKKLPILYVCENNYYSVCSPVGNRQAKNVEIYKKAEGFGLQSESVDGSNVLDVYEATKRAIDHIKQGKCPYFIESHAYRFRGHHGAEEDFNLGHRSEEELLAWKKNDPIEMLKQVLMDDFNIVDNEFEKMHQKISHEIDYAFDFAVKSPNPIQADLLTHVYSN